MGARFLGVTTSVPPKVVTNDAFLDVFDERTVAMFGDTVGVKQRHIVTNHTFCDLAVNAIEKLLAGLNFSPAEIEGIIVITQTGDVRLPSNAYLIANTVGLTSANVIFDINHGCSGYPVGLQQAWALLNSNLINNCLLVAGDISSRVVDPNDQATAMLFGDAVSATLLKRDDHDDFDITAYNLGAETAGNKSLIVRDNGFGSSGSYDRNSTMSKYLDMNGPDVFSFTIRNIPSLLKLIADNMDYDYYLLHQANAFMLKHLVKKSGIQASKFPINIEEFGNTSSASIPLLITTRINKHLKQTMRSKLYLLGFGVGFSWAGVSVNMSPNVFVSHNVCEEK